MDKRKWEKESDNIEELLCYQHTMNCLAECFDLYFESELHYLPGNRFRVVCKIEANEEN